MSLFEDITALSTNKDIFNYPEKKVVRKIWYNENSIN